MRGVDQANVPKNSAVNGVGIKGVKAVVLCGNDDDVVPGTGNGQIRDPQRMGIDGAIRGAGKELAESGSVDGQGGKGKLVSVGAVTRKIIVVGEHAREMGPCDAERGGGLAVADAGGGNGGNAGYGWSGVGNLHARTRRGDRECPA